MVNDSKISQDCLIRVTTFSFIIGFISIYSPLIELPISNHHLTVSSSYPPNYVDLWSVASNVFVRRNWL